MSAMLFAMYHCHGIFGIPTFMYPRVKYPRIFCTPRAKYPKDIRYPVGKKCTPIERLALTIALLAQRRIWPRRAYPAGFKHLTMEDKSIYEIYRRLVHYIITIHSRCSIFTPRAGRRCRCSPYTFFHVLNIILLRRPARRRREVQQRRRLLL